VLEHHSDPILLITSTSYIIDLNFNFVLEHISKADRELLV
jgi:hypothetical protein